MSHPQNLMEWPWTQIEISTNARMSRCHPSLQAAGRRLVRVLESTASQAWTKAIEETTLVWLWQIKSNQIRPNQIKSNQIQSLLLSCSLKSPQSRCWNSTADTEGQSRQTSSSVWQQTCPWILFQNFQNPCCQVKDHQAAGNDDDSVLKCNCCPFCSKTTSNFQGQQACGSIQC